MTTELTDDLAGSEPPANGSPSAGDGGAAVGTRISRRFLSGDQQTRVVLKDIRDGLAALGLSDGDLGTIELVLAEALNNIAEHAYGPEGGPIELVLDLAGGRLRCELRDRGRPMPLGQAPSPDPPVIGPPDALPEGGFGWHIIRCLVAELCYERDGGVNRLQLSVRISARP